jgi:hypothetical protein
MKLHHAFLLALGIATPLWLRQRRFEQECTKELRRFADEVNEGCDAAARSWKRWGNELQKELHRAFREQGGT